MNASLRLHLSCATLLAAVAAGAVVPAYRDTTLSVEERTRDLLARMTTEEKVGQLLQPMGWEMWTLMPDGTLAISDTFREQNSGGMPRGAYWAVLRADPWTQKTLDNGLDPYRSAEALNMLQKYAVDSTRLGIPILFMEECPHGHMAIGATVLPTGLGIASTWNPSLAQDAGRVSGSEARLRGASVGFGPVLDIARDARWSRMEETYGEDPYLAGEIGYGFISGMQEPDPISGRTLYSTPKHFIAYGVPSGGHNGAESTVGPIRLRNDFLPPFRRAMDAGMTTLMTSYNTVDGVPTTANRALLTDMLRGEWGFDGLVMSDLFSIDAMNDGIYGNTAASAAAALKAGVDSDLGANAYGTTLLESLHSGRINMAEIDSAVANVLRVKFRSGVFDYPYVSPARAAKGVRSANNRDIALSLATEGTVMLKNNGTLPLGKNVKRIAVIGPNADNQYNQLGDYTAPQHPDCITTLLEGMRKLAPKGVKVTYAKGCAVRDSASAEIDEAVRLARESDVVILALGGSSARDFRTSYAATGAATGMASDSSVPDMDCGEGFDRSTLSLLGMQPALLEAILATGSPVVAVYIQGRPLDMNVASRQAAAILNAWYPGEAGGEALARIIYGLDEPSGRLPVSVPRSVGQLPICYSYPVKDYMDNSGKPLYPFGFGLGYTTFGYSDLSVTPAPDGKWDVSCTVTNTGSRKGSEVVQLYIRDMEASVSQPGLKLRGFNKIKLNPGESRKVDFTLGFNELSIFDQSLRQVVEPGEFKVFVGSSSDNLPLSGSFTVGD